MDILLQSPIICAPRQLTGTETIEELKAIKSEWLHAAQEAGHLDAIRMLARTLGTRFTLRLWEGFPGWRWENGAGVLVEYFEGNTHYLPARGKYNQVRTLNVYVHGRQVCHYRESDDPRENADNFFVPGSWQATIAEPIEQAAIVKDQRSDAIDDKHRRGLLKQLCVGVDV